MFIGDISKLMQMKTPSGTKQSLPIADDRNKKLAIMLYALGGALRGKSPLEAGLGLSQTLQQQQKTKQQEDAEKRIRNSAAQHLKNLNASEAQIQLAKDDIGFATDVVSQQFKDRKETALIENADYLNDLREKEKLETDPIKKAQLKQQINDFKGLGGMLRYDPSLQYEIEQSKLAAQQGLDLGETPMGAGELKTDQAFGTFYTNYIEKGRGATNIANLERLQDAEEILKIADQNDVDKMESVIQQSLRATLGAQFGEREGEQFIRRGYNPSLSAAENLERLIDLRASLEQLVDSEKDAVEYYEKNKKSLRGYKGKMYNVDSFSRDLATDYKQDVIGLSNEELKNAYMNAREDSIWEKAVEKEIERRYRQGK